MSEIVCFLLTPTSRARRYFRRYEAREGPAYQCHSQWSYHNAKTAIDEIPFTVDADGDRHWPDGADEITPPLATDPRFPTVCAACGHAFAPGAQQQIFIETLYARSDTGAIVTLDEAPPGALWFVDHLAGHLEGVDQAAHRHGEAHLYCKTPGGEWDIDSRSTNGGGWTRTGTAPSLVVRPSILIERRGGTYHGFLGGPDGSKPGILVEC